MRLTDLLLLIQGFGNLSGQDTVLTLDLSVFEEDDDGESDGDQGEEADDEGDEGGAAGFGLLLHDHLLLLLVVIDGGQLLRRMLGLARLQRVLYLEHLLVEVGGPFAIAHPAIDLGQTPLSGVHHLAQGVALLANALNQVIVYRDGLLETAALLHVVHDEIVAGVVALVLDGLPRIIGGVGLLVVAGLLAAGG